MSLINNSGPESSSNDNGYELSAEERSRLESLDVKDPDELLKTSRLPGMPISVIVSLLCHAALLAATSLALFADWQERGVKMPAAIRADKKQEKEAEEERIREAKIAAEREAASKNQDADEGTPATGSGDDATTGGSGNDTDPAEPTDSLLPRDEDREDPASSFNIDDINLDL